ncbi:uncharacterized protein LOC134851512 [Symsagittifera roscoffensis]|uniref:uncharacterized protein LOC134851512 n=1 Tax=Symsagittifera roscoffensis TaxID=84072 RepID=UPI00307CB89F
MFPRNFQGSEKPKDTFRLPPRQSLSFFGKIFVAALLAMVLLSIVFAVCGHGRWVEGDFGYSALWRECVSVFSEFYGRVIVSDCYDLTQSSNETGYNTARMFLIFSHFFAAFLFILLGLNVTQLHDTPRNDAIKILLATGQWGFNLLAASMITSYKGNQSSLKSGSWAYGCVLTWFSWCISCVILALVVLFLVLSSKFRKN